MKITDAVMQQETEVFEKTFMKWNRYMLIILVIFLDAFQFCYAFISFTIITVLSIKILRNNLILWLTISEICDTTLSKILILHGSCICSSSYTFLWFSFLFILNFCFTTSFRYKHEWCSKLLRVKIVIWSLVSWLL